MRRSVCVLAVAAVAALAGSHADAENPIPTNRVPGFGGTIYGTTMNSPSAVGSDIGSNVGAGGNAGPSNDIVSPSNTRSFDDLEPPSGTSGSITVTR